MSAVLLVLTVWLSLMPEVAVAQGNGNGNGDPSLEALVRALKESEDAVDAGIRTVRLLAKGEKGRRCVCRLVADQASLSGVAFQGILRALVGTEERSPEVLDTLFRAYSKTEIVARRDRLRRAFLDYDAHQSLLDPLLGRLADVKANGSRLRLLGLVAALAKKPEELFRATDALISLYEKEPNGEFAKGLQETLVELTGQTHLSTAPGWRSWFETARQSPETFVQPWRRRIEELRSANERLRSEMADAILQAHRRAVDEIVKAGVLPLSYLDAKTGPGVAVRIHALQGLDRAAGQDAKKVQAAILAAVSCLGADEEAPVLTAALDAVVRLGSVKRMSPEVVKPVRAAVEALLSRTSDLDMMVRAARVLQVTGDPATLGTLEKLYRSHVKNDKAEGLRKTIVSVAFNLTQSNPHGLVREALRDPKASVRINATNCLAQVRKPEDALAFAEVLVAEKDPSVAAALVSGLGKLGSFKSQAVLDALLAAAAKPALRASALDVLVAAIASPDSSEERSKALAPKLLALFFDQTTTPASRAQAVARLRQQASPVSAGFVVSLLEKEPDPKLRLEIAEALIAVPRLPVTLLGEQAEAARKREHRAVALRLLREVVTRASNPKASDADKKLLEPTRLKLAGLQLELGNAKGARVTLESIDAKQRDLPWAALHLQAASATNDAKAALADAETLLASDKATPDQKRQAYLVRIPARLDQRSVTARAGALADLDALLALGPGPRITPEDATRAEANRKARDLSAKLDDPKAQAAARAELAKLDPEAATPWLLATLTAAPKPVTAPWLESRHAVLRALHPKDPVLTPLALPKDPKDQKALDALLEALRKWSATWTATTPKP